MVDHLTREQRFRAMSNVKHKNGGLEVIVQSKLRKLGLKFNKHAKNLPGTPDIVFTKEKVAIFVDGDFWHGYHLPLWEHKLSQFWKTKINTNRKRDQRNFRRLRRRGWTVIRIWQHEIRNDSNKCIDKITLALYKTPR